MSLKIEQSCDWCDTRAAVSLPKSGPVNFGDLPLPEGWEAKPAFPDSDVGDPEGQELCSSCAGTWDDVLLRARQARDAVYRQAISSARKRTSPSAARPQMSSSFAR